MACRRENYVADSLWLEVRMTVVIGHNLTTLVEAGDLMLVRGVSKVVRRVESLELLLLGVCTG